LLRGRKQRWKGGQHGRRKEEGCSVRKKEIKRKKGGMYFYIAVSFLWFIDRSTDKQKNG
jgi:hypothetical protein